MALARFQAGETEVLALVEGGGEGGNGPAHRYMAPLLVRRPACSVMRSRVT